MCLENIQKLNFISPLLLWNLSFTSIDRPPNICRCVLCGDVISQKKVGGWENHAKKPAVMERKKFVIMVLFLGAQNNSCLSGCSWASVLVSSGRVRPFVSCDRGIFLQPSGLFVCRVEDRTGLGLVSQGGGGQGSEDSDEELHLCVCCVVWCDFTEKSRRLRKICEKRCYGKEYTLCTLSISFLKKRCAKRSSTCESSLVNCR